MLSLSESDESDDEDLLLLLFFSLLSFSNLWPTFSSNCLSIIPTCLATMSPLSWSFTALAIFTSGGVKGLSTYNQISQS